MGEDSGVCADAEGKRQHHYNSEPWILHQDSHGVAYVLDQRPHGTFLSQVRSIADLSALITELENP